MLNIYLSHYKLKENPFQLTVDPNFFWHRTKNFKAITALKDGLQKNSGLYLLTGDPGTGKTMLINYLSKVLEPNFIIAKVPYPDIECLDFFNSISESFGIKKQFTSRSAFLGQVRNFLYDTYAPNKKALLIIDEAHKITGALLKELDFLSNIKLNDEKNINVLLVGQNVLNNLIEQPESNKQSRKVAQRCILGLLSEKETAGYVRHRLKVAGTTSKIFSSGAIRQIYLFSKGNPRLINSICDHALVTGYSTGKKSIGSSVIKECADELQIVIGDKEISAGEIVENKAQLPINSNILKLFRKPQILIFIALMLLVTVGYLFMVTRLDISSKSSVKQLAQEKYEKIKDKIEAIEAGKNNLSDNFEVSPTKDKIGQKELQPNKESILEFTRTDYIIYFNPNANELTNEAIEILSQIVKVISKHPVSEITILGYTDSSGNHRYNEELSKLRADIVKSYLVAKGISQPKIRAFGLGPKNPIASNETPEGRNKNRRVEVKLNIK
jgi:outer membrane protein OmpA-like peptidoglycan-associated protein/type II secretory pathway predicted ATPase ExeA